MKELVVFNGSEITVQPGVVQFTEYERLKTEALELAANIEQVEVNEENIQVSKKMLAAVNKRLKEMETKRIAVKKEMLKPYETFEQQVKDIVSIVKNAENMVRDQVRDLEEKEREEKRIVIKDLFNKRMKQYSFGETFTFEQFLKPKHLNKTTSIVSVESDMVEWLEKIEADLTAIKTLSNSEEVFAEYVDTKDLSVAIRIVKEREERKKQAEKVVKPVKNEKPKEHKWCITVSEKDALTLEMFMNLQGIKYKIEKVEL